MTRKLIINGLALFALGAFWSYIGFSFMTWQYWVMLVITMIAMINSAID